MLSAKKSVLFASALALASSLSFSGSTSAQDDSIKELLACDKIKNSKDKLECFNAAIEILKQEEEQKKSSSTGNTLLNERSANRTSTRGGDFGFDAAEIERREERKSGKKDQSAKQQIYTFTRYWRDAAGKYYFLMTNGQIWKEIGGSHLIIPKRAKTIRIKKNVLGGFNAYIEGMNGRRGNVKRIR